MSLENTWESAVDQYQQVVVDGYESTDAMPVHKDDGFDILQNPRKRAVLRYVAQHDRNQYMQRAVSDAVAAWEHDTTVWELEREDRHRTYISLHQSGLPRLHELDVVEYDQDEQLVKPEPRLQAFEPYIGDELGADQYVSAETGDQELHKDDVFHLLANPRRRAVIRQMVDGAADIFELRHTSEQIAAWENDQSNDQTGCDERKAVYTALHQSHLPKLDEHDVINYPPEAEEYSNTAFVPQPALSVLEPYVGKDGLHTDETIL